MSVPLFMAIQWLLRYFQLEQNVDQPTNRLKYKCSVHGKGLQLTSNENSSRTNFLSSETWCPDFEKRQKYKLKYILIYKRFNIETVLNRPSHPSTCRAEQQSLRQQAKNGKKYIYLFQYSQNKSNINVTQKSHLRNTNWEYCPCVYIAGCLIRTC